MNSSEVVLQGLSLTLRVISAVAGFVISFGALFFLGSTDSGVSVLIEFGAGISGIAIAFMLVRTIQSGIGRLIWGIAVALAIINGAIATQGYFVGKFGIDVLRWAAANTISVVFLCALAWASSRHNRGQESKQSGSE